MAGKALNFPKVDLTGQRFTRLTVTSFGGYKLDSKDRKAGYWNVVCDCGTKKTLKQNSLVTRAVRSCGCLLDEFRKGELPSITIRRNSLPDGVALFNNLYINYKHRAECVLKIPFEITRDEFRVLIKQPCFYCGVDAIQIFSKRKSNGILCYNGIDRIDNHVGYIMSNAVPCCGICNKAKRDMEFNEFINWIKRLSNYASKINFNYPTNYIG